MGAAQHAGVGSSPKSCRRNLVDHNGTGNEGAVRGDFDGPVSGEEDVQQMAFIILMIITVLPSSATIGHSCEKRLRLEMSNDALWHTNEGCSKKYCNYQSDEKI